MQAYHIIISQYIRSSLMFWGDLYFRKPPNGWDGRTSAAGIAASARCRCPWNCSWPAVERPDPNMFGSNLGKTHRQGLFCCVFYTQRYSTHGVFYLQSRTWGSGWSTELNKIGRCEFSLHSYSSAPQPSRNLDLDSWTLSHKIQWLQHTALSRP